MVTEADVFPAALTCLRDPDELVRKNVTTLMREVVKHTPEVTNIRIDTRKSTRQVRLVEVISVCVSSCPSSL